MIGMDVFCKTWYPIITTSMNPWAAMIVKLDTTSDDITTKS